MTEADYIFTIFAFGLFSYVLGYYDGRDHRDKDA